MEKRKSILQILMTRDKMTKTEAQELISDAREVFDEYLADGDICSAENICEEYFGLEPDYLDEFM